MRLVVLTISFFLFTPLVAFTDIIHVPADQPTIQGGIGAAMNGDTVLVAPGTYVENIIFIGKAITVTSSGGPAVTIIDGGSKGSVVKFTHNEGPDSVLDGFTVTNGDGTPGYFTYNGGGIYCTNASPTIRNNDIRDNDTYYWGYGGAGGGIYSVSGSPLIENNTLSGNVAADHGGGIALFGMGTIRNNRIEGNVIGLFGGGIYCYSQVGLVEILNNEVIGNRVAEDGKGGGICCKGDVLLDGNIVGENVSEGMNGGNGGGIYAVGQVKLNNNLVYGNIAKSWSSIYGEGGGIRCEEDLDSGICTLINNTIVENRGDSEGGGLFLSGNHEIRNTIIWNNIYDFGKSQIYVQSGNPEVTHCNIEGGWTGTGNIDSDPLFVDAAGNDFHIRYTSPCRDTGDNTVSGLPAEDFEGDPRIAHGTVDMGADEFYTHLYWTGNATPGGSAALKFVGLPGTMPVQLWLGSGIIDPPMQTKYGLWHLQFPLLASVGLGTIPADGVLLLPFTFPPSTATPLSMPLQAGIGMELTNLSVIDVE